MPVILQKARVSTTRNTHTRTCLLPFRPRWIVPLRRTPYEVSACIYRVSQGLSFPLSPLNGPHATSCPHPLQSSLRASSHSTSSCERSRRDAPVLPVGSKQLTSFISGVKNAPCAGPQEARAGCRLVSGREMLMPFCNAVAHRRHGHPGEPDARPGCAFIAYQQIMR